MDTAIDASAVRGTRLASRATAAAEVDVVATYVRGTDALMQLAGRGLRRLHAGRRLRLPHRRRRGRGGDRGHRRAGAGMIGGLEILIALPLLGAIVVGLLVRNDRVAAWVGVVVGTVTLGARAVGLGRGPSRWAVPAAVERDLDRPARGALATRRRLAVGPARGGDGTALTGAAWSHSCGGRLTADRAVTSSRWCCSSRPAAWARSWRST